MKSTWLKDGFMRLMFIFLPVAKNKNVHPMVPYGVLKKTYLTAFQFAAATAGGPNVIVIY